MSHPRSGRTEVFYLTLFPLGDRAGRRRRCATVCRADVLASTRSVKLVKRPVCRKKKRVVFAPLG